ncbi:MAG: 16S rRNA (cytidine(1402)-2'-O)-methyltransferase [Bacillota bacterium]|jgi:16S rRNA (cytidine1402-2'-O)-methyltransferase|nr:16S rRNA (cytidine(1402)-2'-O)-methyltransferase [Candidatus Fermentithermobacillaceae bacterium]
MRDADLTQAAVNDKFQAEGVLYICGTPIGNLDDVSFRLIQVLKQVDLIVCEDTRRTRKLLARYDISKPLLAFHEHVERQRTGTVLERLSQGKSVALVSDAGMPLISDPGAYLVTQARESGFKVVVVPGPSAVTAALALVGFPSSRFIFAGFPPRKSKKRQEFFIRWIKPQVPAVFFESPHRLVKALHDLMAAFPSVQVGLCHEMTKAYESAIVGPIKDVYENLKDSDVKGEWVVVAYLESPEDPEEAG